LLKFLLDGVILLAKTILTIIDTKSKKQKGEGRMKHTQLNSTQLNSTQAQLNSTQALAQTLN